MREQKLFLEKKDHVWIKDSENVATLLETIYDIIDDIEADKIAKPGPNSDRDNVVNFIESFRSLLTTEYSVLTPSNYKNNPWVSKCDLIYQALYTSRAFTSKKTSWKAVIGQLKSTMRWMNGFGIKI